MTIKNYKKYMTKEEREHREKVIENMKKELKAANNQIFIKREKGTNLFSVYYFIWNSKNDSLQKNQLMPYKMKAAGFTSHINKRYEREGYFHITGEQFSKVQALTEYISYALYENDKFLSYQEL